ncbi:hypothetical protein [Georgenia sp. SUBG003]
MKFVKLDTDANPRDRAALRHRLDPDVHVYQNGELVKSIVGGKPKKAFTEQLSEFLS